MFYSPSTRGFFSPALRDTNMPDDIIEISDELYVHLRDANLSGKVIRLGADGVLEAVNSDESVSSAPTVVTMRQARLALLAAGKLADVSAAISGLPSPHKEAAQIEWEYAATVDRSSDLTSLLASALSLNEAQLDALFVQASSL